MSRSTDSRRIRLAQRSSLIAAAAAFAWSVLLLATGGFTMRLAGLRITAHDPLRPLLAGALGLTVFILAGGNIARVAAFVARLPWHVRRLWLRWAPPADAVAWSLAAATLVVALVWGSKAVGGADSWGYMSEARLFLRQGNVKVVQPFVAEIPWPARTWTFTPLAYKPLSAYHPVQGEEEWTIVPFYSPGLPLLMALASLVGGYQAMFFVVPLLSAALVIGTYGIGKRLASPAVGLIGAWLVAISPCVLFMMISTMTDVPVAGVFAVAFYLMLGRPAASAAGAGLAAGIGILIRPNMAPAAAAMGLYYAVRVFRPSTRREGWLHGALFSAGVIAASLVIAWMNARTYGAPNVSGYGSLDQYFSTSHILPNLQRYPAWLAESQTPLALVGLAAAFLPIRRLWPKNRGAVVIGALIVAIVWGTYLIYDVYEAWWFSRFLLVSWPFIMLGTGAVVVAVARWRPLVTVPAIAAVLVAVSIHQFHFSVEKNVFNLWAGERRYVVAAQMARRLTPPNSLIIGGQHTGSLRFYAGRMTAHYEPIPTEWVDDAIAWLAARGVHTYLLLEDWEVPLVRERFAGQRAADVLDRRPMAEYRDPGTLYLYDLAEPHVEVAHTEVVTGTYRDFWAARPAPEDATLVFTP